MFIADYHLTEGQLAQLNRLRKKRASEKLTQGEEKEMDDLIEEAYMIYRRNLYRKQDNSFFGD